MPEIESLQSNPWNSQSIQNKNKALTVVSPDSISILGKLDGQTMIQAVVMSELLDKPIAKRRKRGHFKNEGTNCRR